MHTLLRSRKVTVRAEPLRPVTCTHYRGSLVGGRVVLKGRWGKVWRSGDPLLCPSSERDPLISPRTRNPPEPGTDGMTQGNRLEVDEQCAEDEKRPVGDRDEGRVPLP